VTVALLTAGAVYLASYMTYPVTGLRFQGTRMYPESDAWSTIPENASLLTLNSETLREHVESNPWVESATVTKDWDSGIVVVEVEERHAVVNAEVDGRTRVYALDGTELPGLGGAELPVVGTDRVGVGEILAAGRVLERGGVDVDSVDRIGPGGVEATVEGRRVIFGGGVDEQQAEAMEDIMEESPDAAVFDLRSSGRVLVSKDG
jgi:cell division protein FtsQ